MKIFRLQSKIGLVIWSVIFAFVMQYLTYTFTDINIDGYCPEGKVCHIGEFVGWPIEATINMVNNHYSQIWIENFVFWIITVFIILSLVSYFRNRKI